MLNTKLDGKVVIVSTFSLCFFFNPAFNDDKQAGAELGQAQVLFS